MYLSIKWLKDHFAIIIQYSESEQLTYGNPVDDHKVFGDELQDVGEGKVADIRVDIWIESDTLEISITICMCLKQCSGSMTFWYGPGSNSGTGSCSFRQWLSRRTYTK